MGIGTLGFLRGAAKTQLDTMDEREKQRMLMERDKKLEELRREGESIAFKRAEEAKGKEVKEERVNADGTIEKVNSRGEVIGTRQENALEKQARENRQRLDALTLEDKEVGILNTRDTIRSRKYGDSLDAQKTQAYVGSMNRSNRPESGGIDSGGAESNNASNEDAAARQLVTEFDKTVTDSLRGTGVARAEVEQIALGMVRSSRTGQEARERFRNYIASLGIAGQGKLREAAKLGK